MAYSDPQFNVRVMAPALGTVTGTATAANANDITIALALRKFKRATKISAIRVQCSVIDNASATNETLVFMNGTNTVGSLTVGTMTAGEFKDATLTANVNFAADDKLTAKITGTYTASADALGSYLVDIETTELFS